MRKLRIGVVGVGHFGSLHAQKLAAMPCAHLQGVYDLDYLRAEKIAIKLSCQAFSSLEELTQCCVAVVIATPARMHFVQAQAVLGARRHVFIEKPLAQTVAQASQLEALVKQTSCVCHVGHLLRFSPAYRIIEGKIHAPLYVETLRMAPFTERGTDVSVVLDMMSHDLDLILALVGSTIEHVEALGAAVSSSQEDIANARINFANGAVANLMVSRISLRQERRLRLFSREGYISADFKKRRLQWINRREGLPLPGKHGFRGQFYTWKTGDALYDELQAFVLSCLDGQERGVGVVEGATVLRAAHAIEQAMERRKGRMQQSGLLTPASTTSITTPS